MQKIVLNKTLLGGQLEKLFKYLTNVGSYHIF